MSTVQYDAGYRDAIMDIRSWFGMPGRKSFLSDIRINQKNLCSLLFVIQNNRFAFENEKEEFDMCAIKDKKSGWEFRHVVSRDDCRALCMGSPALGDVLFSMQIERLKETASASPRRQGNEGNRVHG